MAMLSTSGFIENLDYTDHSTAKLLGVPLALFVLALVVLGGSFALTGTPVGLGVEFVGGTELRVAPTDAPADAQAALGSAFPAEPASIREIPSDGTYVVTFTETGTDVAAIEAAAESAGFEVRSSSQVTPSFGGETQRLALFGLLGAFVGMSLIVFGLFRTFVPSFAVVASAASDLVVPLAVMAIVGIDLSLGTVAALLMLIGYSVDSDILLNDYVIRRGGSFYESVYGAMETGVTMTLTSLLAMVVLAVTSAIFGIPLLRDIGFVLAVGLCVDLVNTYMMNVAILRWYKFEGVSR
jgi:preprotein translocase subunit SecF